jgi:tetratricopeptide (TPR) repeat protein
LIIKANALYRLALEEKTGFDDAKIYYTMANKIRESYDTWFGLGNIDRQEEKFADALEKYNKAKNYATETDEIDLEIKRVLSMISNV